MEIRRSPSRRTPIQRTPDGRSRGRTGSCTSTRARKGRDGVDGVVDRYRSKGSTTSGSLWGCPSRPTKPGGMTRE